MDDRSEGPVPAPTAHPRPGDHADDAQMTLGPNGLTLKIPPPDSGNDRQLPPPFPTPSPSPPSAVSGTDLPTIHSDEDYASSSASSPQTHAGQNDGSEPSSLSDSAMPSLPKMTDATKIENDGDHSPETRSINSGAGHENVRRLSAAGMQHLTASPHSLPIAVVPDQGRNGRLSASELQAIRQSILLAPGMRAGTGEASPTDPSLRGTAHPRTTSTPPMRRNRKPSVVSSPRRNSFHPLPQPMNLRRSLPNTPIPHYASVRAEGSSDAGLQTPAIPIPPVSLPTHLQLELAGQRPSPLYIQRPDSADVPYESSAVKMERLLNMILLPPYLERTLVFGVLACLDSWLYTFTILPLRFLVALWILIQWWGHVFAKEVRWITGFVWYGLGRLWVRGRIGRRRKDSVDAALEEDEKTGQGGTSFESWAQDGASRRRASRAREGSQGGGENAERNSGQSSSQYKPRPARAMGHRRTKSRPSNLSAYNKADLLQGLIVLCSAMALMKLDGSRMYHFIRAQSDIKLYVIFNILEVGDRLLGAIGQDILECLFSSETLSRNSSGRSKVLMPLGMFLMALVYNVVHAVALYYQCITLNVAVNSYSNALLTLLMSNQFVEVKGAVFKRFEKDNLFQLTCADIVERFQLWVMLLIIGLRNVVEVGGLSVPGVWGGDTEPSGTVPLHSPTILPHSFTVLPNWLWSGEVLSPFLIIIGSEMFVDVIKHAYIGKFNNIKPGFYGRILDILSKDYYTNAFTTPSLTRRLGLPAIPLSCLFIRASFQTYHTFLSTRLSPPLPSTHTSLTEKSVPTSPAVTAALERFDTLIRDALGRSVYGDPLSFHPPSKRPWYSWTTDDLVAALTMVVFFFLVFLILLMVKLVLGMALLSYSRGRYAAMRAKEAEVARGEKEKETFDAPGERKGGWGFVEVGSERKAWLNADPREGLPRKERGGRKGDDLERVSRYEMVAKRIW
ncbi:related to membrane protein [Cephalotrichum gorgonifer]|uniref:Related to membrane protein n=1 Tax=Cephalotrichum gorgonifer TaxID=2041049 RepID=A0AAE8SXD9_9PEZI|nr:related to membrane protein [Cephalotrichum gorgonifer]